MKKLTYLLFIAFLGACTPRTTTKPSTPDSTVQPDDTITFTPPKNIILMIGDGMGLTQITAAMYKNGNKLNLEQFRFIGFQKTYSADNLITDSAASATAMGCGVKTNNGAIGIDKDGKPVQSILEAAEAAGLATGIVVTSSITHATPACFYAHQRDRAMMEEIAADLLNVDVDFFVGGGTKYFARRKDERNLLVELTKKGYVLSSAFEKDFNDLTIDFSKNFGYFTADGEPLPFSQGRDYLVQASGTAVTYLSSQPEGGFFLMIEGSQIDWGGHANDADYVISEMIDFDNAIGEVLKFAMEDGQTLVIVTSDHETGGFAINPGSKMDSLIIKFTTDKHTAILVPVFAFGPGAELFSGIYENTAIFDKMRRAFGFVKT